MQIKKDAQGCRLGNQAEFVQRPHRLYKYESAKKLHRREHFRVR